MGAQTWNSSAFGGNNLASLGATNRMKPPQKARAGIPTVSPSLSSLGDSSNFAQAWMDQPQPMQSSSPYLGLGGGMLGNSSIRSDQLSSEPDEELIPTAIVIKNIPFAVKKEQLVQLMTDMGLPLPYAFNYHFDNGVFRGLAFANFTSPDETAAVIDNLNHFELQGRKLRVEYKKMLPAAERERIEREKRERRGQLEEQHRPMPSSALHSQASMSSLTSHFPPPTSPSPVSARNVAPGMGDHLHVRRPSADVLTTSAVDLNDPESLNVYSKLLLFKEDNARELVVFPSDLTPPQRRIVHTIAHHMGLMHMSKGQADQRAVHVFKEQARQRLSPPMPQIQNIQIESQRRGLSRAATTDFSDVRNQEAFYNGGVRHQNSAYLSGFQESPNTLAAGPNLRAAKSFADLRSYTPSPVPSTASFPATLGNNVSRFAEYARENGSAATPTLPTPTSSALGSRDDGLLVNGLGNMSLGGPGFGGSPRGLRGMMSWDRESNPGPIGGHRAFSASNNYDDQARDRGQGLPSRQPRGPIPERGSGFPRRNGHMNRGSDELSQQSSGVEITVE